MSWMQVAKQWSAKLSWKRKESSKSRKRHIGFNCLVCGTGAVWKTLGDPMADSLHSNILPELGVGIAKLHGANKL